MVWTPCLGVPGSSLDAAAPKGLNISGAFWVSNPVLVGGEMQKMLDNVGLFFFFRSWLPSRMHAAG